MKASELRIGVSLVYWCGKVPVQFNGTHIYGEGQFSIGNQKTMPQVRYDGYEFYQVSWDDLSPIPLTPEILEKCGFEYEDMGDDSPYERWVCKKYKELWVWNYNKTEEWLFCLGDGFEQGNYEYLHQLQNLYFALTKTELKVDISKLQSSPSK